MKKSWNENIATDYHTYCTDGISAVILHTVKYLISATKLNAYTDKHGVTQYIATAVQTLDQEVDECLKKLPGTGCVSM